MNDEGGWGVPPNFFKNKLKKEEVVRRKAGRNRSTDTLQNTLSFLVSIQ